MLGDIFFVVSSIALILGSIIVSLGFLAAYLSARKDPFNSNGREDVVCLVWFLAAPAIYAFTHTFAPWVTLVVLSLLVYVLLACIADLPDESSSPSTDAPTHQLSNSKKSENQTTTYFSSLDHIRRQVNLQNKTTDQTYRTNQSNDFESTSIEYPSNWDDLRRKVYIRDKYTCQNCSASKVVVHAHHVVPLSAGGTNRISNLITLCADCHSKIHPHMRTRNSSQVEFDDEDLDDLWF